MDCLSFNYHNADVNVRKQLAFTDSDKEKIIISIAERTGGECVLLCTCNRTEVYFSSGTFNDKVVIDVLSGYSSADEKILSRYKMYFKEKGAVQHLFKVSCGIDSMVIGEDEILRQTKDAYAFSQSLGVVSYEFNMIFQSAFACAKRVKTQTALSKTSVSTATLTASEVAKLGNKVNVLVIGATGEIGRKVLKNLVSHKNIEVTATLRHHNSEYDFIEKLPIRTVPYNHRYQYIDEADCIISATSSPHFTVTQFDIEKSNITKRKRLYIDLAVPPDIDPKISELEGARLINIDYFERLASENNAIKLDCVETAKEYIEQDIGELEKNLVFHSFLPNIDKLKLALGDMPVEKIIYKMKSEADPKEFKSFIEIMKMIFQE